MKTISFNNTASNRVLLATFDKNWKRTSSDGRVVYTATSDRSVVQLLIKDAVSQTLVFRKGKTILVVGSTFHFSPHIQVLQN